MDILTLAQLITGIVSIFLILLQRSSDAGGGLLGSGEGGGFTARRRGVEKTLFIATICAVGFFLALSILNFAF